MTEKHETLSRLERLRRTNPPRLNETTSWIVKALCAEIDRIEETRVADLARQDRRMDSIDIQIKNTREVNASYLARIQELEKKIENVEETVRCLNVYYGNEIKRLEKTAQEHHQTHSDNTRALLKIPHDFENKVTALTAGRNNRFESIESRLRILEGELR